MQIHQYVVLFHDLECIQPEYQKSQLCRPQKSIPARAVTTHLSASLTSQYQLLPLICRYCPPSVGANHLSVPFLTLTCWHRSPVRTTYLPVPLHSTIGNNPSLIRRHYSHPSPVGTTPALNCRYHSLPFSVGTTPAHHLSVSTPAPQLSV